MNGKNPRGESGENRQKQISDQIEAIGNLACRALDSSVVADIGNQQDQHRYVGKVASAVSVLCQSIVMQISAGALMVVQATATGRAAIKINRLGTSTLNSLEDNVIAACGPIQMQHAYIEKISKNLKESCDSIADDLRFEDSQGLVQ